MTQALETHSMREGSIEPGSFSVEVNELAICASHPPIAERVNAKHYAEVDPEAPSHDRPPLLQYTESKR